MRHFRTWSGAKPSTDNKTFTIAWGDSRTNPKYWVVSPQKSREQLNPPSVPGSPSTSLSSSGVYTTQVTNGNIDDAIFKGELYFNNTLKKTFNILLPAKTTLHIREQFSLIMGANKAEIRNAMLVDVGYGLTINSAKSTTMGIASYTKIPPGVVVTIPALQTGIASVTYNYTDGSGVSRSINASGSAQNITVQPNNYLSFTVTSKKGYLSNNSNSTTYSTSWKVENAPIALPTMYAKFDKPEQITYIENQYDITFKVRQNTDSTWAIEYNEVAEYDHNEVVGGSVTSLCNPGTITTMELPASCGSVVYYRYYMPAQGAVRASDYQYGSASTSPCSTTT